MRWLKWIAWLVALLLMLAILDTPKPAQAAHPDFVWPMHHDGITTYFSSWHLGLDLACQVGYPVYAAKAGSVTWAGWDLTGYGNRVDLYDGIDLTRYGHLNAIWVTYGQLLSKGQQLGICGATGNATGPHLHFEVWWQNTPVNPLVPLP